jgi:hypothetical protein
MIREELYIKMAKEFQTPVGMAIPIGGTTTDVVVGREPEINRIINRAIKSNLYQSLSKRVWEIEKKSVGRRIGKNSIYKRAFKEITNEQ